MDAGRKSEATAELNQFLESPGGQRFFRIVRSLVDSWLDSFSTQNVREVDAKFYAGGVAFARELLRLMGSSLAYGEHLDLLRERQIKEEAERLRREAESIASSVRARYHPRASVAPTKR